MEVLRLAVAVFLATGVVWSQQYVISTVAGGAPPPTQMAALNSSIGTTLGVVTDGAGNIYFSSLDSICVFKLAQNGMLTLVAGNGRLGYSGDGAPAINSQLNGPSGLAMDSVGNLYIADAGNRRVRKVSTVGIITTVAGGDAYALGDGGPAINAQLSGPSALAFDSAGNLYIGESVRVRKVSPVGTITTVAGNGSRGYSGDGGPATSAQFQHVDGISVDKAGNLYIADNFCNCIRMVGPNGTITTVAGDGIAGNSGDGGPATSARLNHPDGVTVDGFGNVYIADSSNFCIRKVSANASITTLASGLVGAPLNLAVSGSGNLYVAAGLHIQQVSPIGTVTTVAGNGSFFNFSGDGGSATSARLLRPLGIAPDNSGNLYIADSNNNRVRKVSSNGSIVTVAGGGEHGYSEGGQATLAVLQQPNGVAIDGLGNLYIADSLGVSIRKVAPNGIITTVVGNGTVGYSGDGGPAIAAQLSYPQEIAIDTAGNLYINDTGNYCIRKVSTTGTITTVAGNSTQGYSGDGGPAIAAQLSYPQGVAVDKVGNLYIADFGSSRVRKVSTDGVITTIAGNGTIGYSGDGQAATTATLVGPNGVAIDLAGNVYFAEGGVNDSRIRKVLSNGIITTIAGNGLDGYTGDGGPAIDAQLNEPGAVWQLIVPEMCTWPTG